MIRLFASLAGVMAVDAQIALILFLCVPARAQTPRFDVASIKPTQHGRTADGWSFSDVKIAGPGRFMAVNASIDEVIRWAYGVKEFQVSEPAWLKSDAECFDIEAKAPPGTPPERIRLMARTLLAERFGLVLHTEKKTFAVYALAVGKGGAKLQPGTVHEGFTSRGGTETVRISSDGGTMAQLADRLSLDLDRPVLDQTGIQGSFRISIEWAREGDGASIFSAIQDLGLKLQPTRAPFEILVVDHAEKTPSEN